VARGEPRARRAGLRERVVATVEDTYSKGGGGRAPVMRHLEKAVMLQELDRIGGAPGRQDYLPRASTCAPTRRRTRSGVQREPSSVRHAARAASSTHDSLLSRCRSARGEIEDQERERERPAGPPVKMQHARPVRHLPAMPRQSGRSRPRAAAGPAPGPGSGSFAARGGAARSCVTVARWRNEPCPCGSARSSSSTGSSRRSLGRPEP